MTDAEKLIPQISKIISDNFPNSSKLVRFNTRFLNSVEIDFVLGTKKEWANGIIQNAPLSFHAFIYNFDNEGNAIKDKYSFEPAYCRLTIKSTNPMYAYQSIKIPTRKGKGDEKQLINSINKFFKNMKKIVVDNKHLMTDEHQKAYKKFF